MATFTIRLFDNKEEKVTAESWNVSSEGMLTLNDSSRQTIAAYVDGIWESFIKDSPVTYSGPRQPVK